MKCSNCGRKMSDDAKFCEMCGTPVGADQKKSAKTKPAKAKPEVDPHYDLSVFSADSPSSPKPQRPAPVKASPPAEDDSAKTVLLPEAEAHPSTPAKAAFDSAPENDDAAKTVLLSGNEAQPMQRNRFEENIALNRRLRNSKARAGYQNDYQEPRRDGNYRGYPAAGQDNYRDGYRDDSREANRYDPGESGAVNRQAGRYVDEPPKKNKQKKVLIISLTALILVIAILIGVFFFVSRNNVSTAELQEAKDKFVPPAQAVTIDASLEDPSDDNIRFTYDDRARILSCSYKANDKSYEQQYTYHDSERQLDIETTYRSKPVETKIISYDQVTTPYTFTIVDDYYVRLDNESMIVSAETSAPAATESQSQSTTQTELREENISEYPQLEAFLSRYIMWGPKNYDARHVLDDDSNILKSVANYYSCVDPKNYPGSGIYTINAYEAVQIWPWETDRQNMAAFEKTEADWICKNIFHVTDKEITTLYNKLYDKQTMFTDNVNYYSLWDIKSNAIVGKLKSVKTDGKYYYVVYDEYKAVDNSSTPRYAVMEFKTIDDKEYWTMHYHSETVPDTIIPYDSEGR